MARILVATLGSLGDLFPYMAVGLELQRRGHCVTIATSETYRARVEAEKLRFASVRPDISLDDSRMLGELFDQRRGSERVLRGVASVVRETWEDTLIAAQDADVVVTHIITFAAVLVAEKLQLPWVSTVLAPASFVSAYDPPIPAPFPSLVKLRMFGPGIMRGVWNFAKRTSLPWLEPVARLRAEVGLKPGLNPVFEGSHSPGLVLALFSGVFAEPQPDWPARTVVTGFPFYDAVAGAMPVELERFLEAGPPPVVFTLGSSAVGAAGGFYSESLEAVTRLKMRAVFLTGSHAQGLPDPLPADVLACPYAPHGPLFARSSAIVHQGGIGTTAQALRSGLPALVVPFAHDQFDNAERVCRLGAGSTVARRKYNARTAEAALQNLLKDSVYTQRASQTAARLSKEDGAAAAAQAIENYLS